MTSMKLLAPAPSRAAATFLPSEVDGLIRTVVGIERRLNCFQRRLDRFFPSEASAAPAHPQS